MERYNYLTAMAADIKNYVKDHESLRQRECETTGEYRGRLYYALIEVDAITGGTSGSYTFSEWKAEEYLCHNWNLLCEALNEFSYGDMGKLLEKGPEACDVAIRCYLLREAINIADDELREYYDSEEGA